MLLFFIMITRPTLCPAGSTFWNKTPKSRLPINQISSSFFWATSTAVTESNRMQYGSFRRTNISKLNFASSKAGGTAGLPAVRWSSCQQALMYFS